MKDITLFCIVLKLGQKRYILYKISIVYNCWITFKMVIIEILVKLCYIINIGSIKKRGWIK